jgi:hypothetical protein
MTAEEFRSDGDLRAELHAVLHSNAFRIASQIIANRNRLNEAGAEAANLDAPAERSLRLYSQRVGRDGIMADLFELASTIEGQPIDPPSTFGEEESYSKLQSLTEKTNA